MMEILALVSLRDICSLKFGVLVYSIQYLKCLLFCADIDECKLDSDQCAQTCINTIGSYTCSCSEGYLLNGDRRGCSGEAWV